MVIMSYLAYLPDDVFIYEIFNYLEKYDIEKLSSLIPNHEEVWKYSIGKYYSEVFHKKYWVNQTWNQYFSMLINCKIIPVHYEGELEDYLLYNKLNEEIDYRYIIEPKYNINGRSYVIFSINEFGNVLEDFSIRMIISINNNHIDFEKSNKTLSVSHAVILNHGTVILKDSEDRILGSYPIRRYELVLRNLSYIKLNIYNNLFYPGSIPIYTYSIGELTRLVVASRLYTDIKSISRGKSIKTYTLNELKDIYNTLTGGVTIINDKNSLEILILLKVEKINHHYNFN